MGEQELSEIKNKVLSDQNEEDQELRDELQDDVTDLERDPEDQEEADEYQDEIKSLRES